MNRIIRAIVELIKASKATEWSPLATVKQVYFGDPRKIPQANMPAVVVSWVETDYSIRGTATNLKRYKVDIHLVYNAKDYYEETPSNTDKVLAVEWGNEMTIGTLENGETIATTIVWVIEANPKLPYTNDEDATVFACLFCSVDRVRQMMRTDRKFHTYEIITTVTATTIADNA